MIKMKKKILCILAILALTLGCLQEAEEVNVITCWNGVQVLNESHCLPEEQANDALMPVDEIDIDSTTTLTSIDKAFCDDKANGKYCDGIYLTECMSNLQISKVSCERLTSTDGLTTVEGHCLRNACHALVYL